MGRSSRALGRLGSFDQGFDGFYGNDAGDHTGVGSALADNIQLSLGHLMSESVFGKLFATQDTSQMFFYMQTLFCAKNCAVRERFHAGENIIWV